jgi:hypothetical protein
MMAEVEIRNERVDDLPLLVPQQDQMVIAEVIDENIDPHWLPRSYLGIVPMMSFTCPPSIKLEA